MQAFPHHYHVSASALHEGDVSLQADKLTDIPSQAPAEFGGPGDRWSPETLLTAAVADCFALGFRAIAAASKVPFTELNVDVEGVLDREGKVLLFTEMYISAELVVPEGVDAAKADRLLHMAEESCLITNSLNLECQLKTRVSAG